jgi:hypothetical protein
MRMFLTFAFIFVLFVVSTFAFRNTDLSQRWSLTKMLAYSIICSMLTMGAMLLFVIFY